MALMHFLTVVAIIAATIAPTLATDFVVGGDNGWTLGFDYQTWANGQEFHVGDKLIFKYKQGAHNVQKVNGTAFRECAAPAIVSDTLTTGNDVITLATPGRKWYICGIGSHCETGNMKFVITVLPQVGSPAPAPSTPGSNPPSSADRENLRASAIIIAAFGAFLAFLV